MSTQLHTSTNFIIYGEPASKANSRKIVKFGNRPALIKSDKARNYEKIFAQQCPILDNPLESDVKVELITALVLQ